MKTIIVYFHGYGSSKESDKVQWLREHFDNVYAFDIPINHTEADGYLEEQIDFLLLDYLHEDIQLIFIGNSLGSYWASHFAYLYDVKAILINPSYSPRESLKKYGVSDDICNEYQSMIWSTKFKYFISEHDEVINFSKIDLSSYDITIIPQGTHHLDKDMFDFVIQHLGIDT